MVWVVVAIDRVGFVDIEAFLNSEAAYARGIFYVRQFNNDTRVNLELATSFEVQFNRISDLFGERNGRVLISDISIQGGGPRAQNVPRRPPPGPEGRPPVRRRLSFETPERLNLPPHGFPTPTSR